MKTVIATLFAIALLMVVSTAYAGDINFGSTARSIGFGGAGLALGDDSATTAVLNPASSAVSGAKFKFIVPGIDFSSTGASFGDILDAHDKITGGSVTGALDLINTFGKHPTTMGLSLVTGFAGKFGLTFEAEARRSVIPGAAAGEWAGAGQAFRSGTVNLATLTSSITNANFQSTVSSALAGNTAAANTSFGLYLNDLSQNFVGTNTSFVLPAIHYSAGVQTEKGNLYVGTNLKFLQTEARQWQITATPGSASPITVAGGAVNADVDYAAVEVSKTKKNTIKADVGAIYKPNDSIWQYGIVVNNLVKPETGSLAAAQSDAMVSVGIASHPLPGMTVAADIVNITGANDEKASVRMGGEWRFTKFFAARAGYGGKSFTYGVDLFGLNLAFAGKTPKLLTQVLRF